MKFQWLKCLGLETGAMCVLTGGLVGAVLIIPPDIGKWAYGLVMWGVIPCAGAVCAYRATRGGLSGYAAWAIPCVCQTAVHWLMLGYPPQTAGMPMLCGAFSLVAAAAGQVMNERKTTGTGRRVR